MKNLSEVDKTVLNEIEQVRFENFLKNGGATGNENAFPTTLAKDSFANSKGICRRTYP